MIAAAVNCLVTDSIGNAVSVVAKIPRCRSANPAAFLSNICLPRASRITPEKPSSRSARSTAASAVRVKSASLPVRAARAWAVRNDNEVPRKARRVCVCMAPSQETDDATGKELRTLLQRGFDFLGEALERLRIFHLPRVQPEVRAAT